MVKVSVAVMLASKLFWSVLFQLGSTDGFLEIPKRTTFMDIVGAKKFQRKKSLIVVSSTADDVDDSGFFGGGDGRNWIEKSSPMGIGSLDDMGGGQEENMEGNYDLGVNGESFETGSLSKRMYDALMSVAMKRFPPGSEIPSELQDIYTLYAMDMTAKEATQAALKQNGLELAVTSTAETFDVEWGQIDNVRLFEDDDQIYGSWKEAIEEGDWEPGMSFSFVVRNVPVKVQEVDISEILQSLDPDGSLRNEAKGKGMLMPDEELSSLTELRDDCLRRAKITPIEAETEQTVFKGDSSKGYRVIQRSDMLRDSINRDGTENRAVLMHVMDAMVNHGCLVVDVSDGGASFNAATKLANMWKGTEAFFNKVEHISDLPPMQTAEGLGSKHGVVGFSTFPNRDVQVLETRLRRRPHDQNFNIIPEQLSEWIGGNNCQSFIDSFDVMSDIGKDIVRIAVAASSIEAEAFLRPTGKLETSEDDDTEMGDMPFISGLTFEDAEVLVATDEDRLNAAIWASKAATLLTQELIDDGMTPSTIQFEGSSNINMSPHRICRYGATQKDGNQQTEQSTKEIFGAHTDTSFVTLVPVAAVSGLEVFDEDSEQWYRPELKARKTWEEERLKRGLDPSAQFEIIIDENGEEFQLPWHARYVVAMPGELLQLVTRDEIQASVHRVVASTEKTRLSSPVLLRCRNGLEMNVERYLGNMESVGSIFDECHGVKMEDIYSALQNS